MWNKCLCSGSLSYTNISDVILLGEGGLFLIGFGIPGITSFSFSSSLNPLTPDLVIFFVFMSHLDGDIWFCYMFVFIIYDVFNVTIWTFLIIFYLKKFSETIVTVCINYLCKVS